MSLFEKVFLGRLEVLLKVLPIVSIFAIMKLAFHYYGLEPFRMTLLPLFTTTLASIIFVLGFLLAGVITDYKEAEKIPSEMLCSLKAIWDEADILVKTTGSIAGKDLQQKIYSFLNRFREDFLIQKKNDFCKLLDTFSETFMIMDKEEVPPPFMAGLRNEQTNLRRQLTRIRTMRETFFAKRVYIVAELTIVLFAVSLLLIKADPFIQDLFFSCLFVFMSLSILLAIQDMDNPFEYIEGVKSVDEINFDVLYEFLDEVRSSINLKNQIE